SAAESTRAGADDYALGLLETLESEVGKALAGVQKGITVLDDRRAELAAAEVDASFDDEPGDQAEYVEGDDEDDGQPGFR
ncbi:MAG: hypothetical protein ABIQ17_05590, partial [Candidatus Limnocylindrales bacterium]